MKLLEKFFFDSGETVDPIQADVEFFSVFFLKFLNGLFYKPGFARAPSAFKHDSVLRWSWLKEILVQKFINVNVQVHFMFHEVVILFFC